MAVKDLMFTISIFDDTKSTLKEIEANLKGLTGYARETSKSISDAVKAVHDLGGSIDIKVPSLDRLIEQVHQLQALDGRVDASGLKNLQKAAKDFGSVLSEMGKGVDGNAITNSMNKAAEAIGKAIPDLSKATSTSLGNYKDSFESAFRDIIRSYNILRDKLSSGSYELFPKNTNETLRSLQISNFEKAYKKLIDVASNYSSSMNRSLGDVGSLNQIIEKVNEVASAIDRLRHRTAAKGIFDGMAGKSEAELQKIIEQLNKLESQLSQFGNKSYPDVMKGFITSVNAAVAQVEEKLKGLSNIQPNIGSTAEAHNQNASAINNETEAIKQQEATVNSLNEKLARYKAAYEEALAASQKFAGKEIWKVKSDMQEPVINANYELEKALNTVFANAFKGLDFSRIANGNPSLTDPERIIEGLRNALANGNKNAIANAKEGIRLSAVNDTYAKSAQNNEVIEYLERVSASAKKNSIDFKAAQYALEQYKLAISTAKDPKFADVKKAYADTQEADKKYALNRRELSKVEFLEESKKYYEQTKAELKKEQEELAKMQQQAAASRQQGGGSLLTEQIDQQIKAAREKLAQLEKEWNNIGVNNTYPGAAKFTETQTKAINEVKQKIASLNETKINITLGNIQPQHGQGKELEINDKNIITPLENVQTRIHEIVEKLKQDIAGSLKDAFNTDISSEKLIQQLNNLATGIEGIEEKMKMAAVAALSIKEATTAVQGAKDAMKAVHDNSTTAAENGSKDNSSKELQNLLKNQEMIDALIVKTKKAQASASDVRDRIVKAGGKTDGKDGIDKYMEKLNKLLEMLNKVRSDGSFLSQKGLITIPREGDVAQLAQLLAQITGQKGAGTLGDLMKVVQQLTTPSGAVNRTIQAEADGFARYAKQIEASSKALDTARGAVERRNILSTALSDITSQRDVNLIKGKTTSVKDTDFNKLMDATGVNKSLQDIQKFKSKIDALSESELKQKGKVANLQAEYNKLTSIYRKHLSQLNQLATAQERANQRGKQSDLTSLNTAIRKYAELEIKVNKYKETLDTIKSNPALSAGLGSEIRQFEALISSLENVLRGLNALRTSGGMFTDPSGNIYRAKDILDGHFGADAIRASNLNSEFQKQIKSSKGSVADLQTEANKAFASVTQQVTRLSRTMQDGAKYNVDVTNLEAALNKLRTFQTELDAIAKNGGSLNGKTAKAVITSPDYQAAISQAKLEQFAVAAAVSEKKQLEAANRGVTNSENSVARAMENATNAARNQSQVISDLKSMAQQYVSVWGAWSIVKDMANITGALELQERSLEVILGNASAAQQMYSQIRDLSQKSPYTFEDLLKSHRQLAAFGIEANDIFGTLKSLSDIGAGLDVDVSRLILAYGHTKSYGYLSGIQNRQFETAGIDLVGALTDHYNKLAEAEKKAGRYGEFVTRADMFKRMRERSIPFEDVQQVIMDLDKPGGKFYNMQIRQYDTLGGKLRNLNNNYRIMMSEMGSSNHGLLAGTVDMLNELTGNWQKYSRILKGIVVAYGAVKLAALATGKAVMAGNKAITAAAFRKNTGQASAQWLNGQASWWTAASAGSAPSAGLDGEIKNLGKSKKISNLQKQRIALSNRLNEAQRYYLLRQAGVDMATSRTLATASRATRAWKSFQLAMMGAAQSAKAFAASLLLNPMTYIMALVAAVTALSSKFSEMSEKSEAFGDKLKDATKTNSEGIKQALAEYESLYSEQEKPVNGWHTGAEHFTLRYVDLNEAELDGRNLTEMFDNLRKQLETQSPIYDGDFYNINKAKEQEDRIKEGFNTLQRLKYVNDTVNKNSGKLKDAIDDGHATWNPVTWVKGEDYLTNANDFQKARNDFYRSISVDDSRFENMSKSSKQIIENYMKELGVTRDEAFARYLLNRGHDKNWLEIDATAGAPNMNKYWEAAGDIGKDTSDVKNIAKSLSETFMTAYRGNAPAMTEHFGLVMNQIFTQANIADDDTKEYLAMEVATAIHDVMEKAGDKADANAFFNGMMEQLAGGKIDKILQDKLNPHMNPQQAKSEVNKAIVFILNALSKSNSKFASWWKSLAKDAKKAYISEWQQSGKGIADMMLGANAWQKAAYDFKVPINFKTDVDYTKFIEDTRKRIKEAEDKLKANRKRIKLTLGIDISPDFQFSNSAQAKKYADMLQKVYKREAKQIENFTKSHRDKNGYVHGKDWATLQDMRNTHETTKDYYDMFFSAENNAAFLENQKQNLHDDKKNKNGGNHRAYQDPFAKIWGERIRVLKEANQWYKKWNAEIGQEGAMQQVLEKFGSIFNEWKTDKRLPLKFDIKDIDNIEKYITEIRDKALKRYNKQKNSKKFGFGEQAMRVVKEANSALEDIKFEHFTERAQKWSSQTGLYLDRLAKKWENFNKIREATGDKDLAVRMSGADAEDFTTQAEQLQEKIKNDLERYGIKGGLTFDDMFNLDDKGIEDYAKRMLGTTADADKIKAITEELKKWRSLQEAINDASMETYAHLVGEFGTAARLIKKANDEYQRTKEQLENDKNNKVIGQSEYEQALGIAEGKKQVAIMEATRDYKNLLAGNTSYNTGSLQKVGKDAIDELAKALASGKITAEQYNSKRGTIRDAMRKMDDVDSESWYSTFINKGIQGIYDRKSTRANDNLTVKSQELEQATREQQLAQIAYEKSPTKENKEKLDKANAKKDKAQGDVDKAQKALEQIDQASGDFKKLDKATQDIIKGFNAANGALSLITKALDTFGLGDTAAGQAASDSSDVLGSMLGGASALSAAGPYGMAAGAALGLATGIAGLHDKHQQKLIEKIQKDVSKIESYESTIEKAQERSLGYDNGDIMRGYRDYYDSNNYFAYDKADAEISRLRGEVMKQAISSDSTDKQVYMVQKLVKELQSNPLGSLKAMEYNNGMGQAGYKMAEYYDNAAGVDAISGYEQQYDLLIKKRKDYMDMYNAENDKKKKSDSALEEYKSKISELDDEIRYFGEDLAKNLWSIDLKSWADQLGDALMSAFENGENAAKAFDDTVKSLLQTMFSQMLKLGILEPMFKSLREDLFGNGNDKKGVFDPSNVQGSLPNVQRVIADYFKKGGQGEQAIAASQAFYNAANAGLKDAGLTLDNDSSSTLSSGIASASEETTGLLAGYVNALRQDVAVIRLMQAQYFNDMWQDYVGNVTNGAEALKSIDTNVQAIKSILSENGELYEQIRSLRDDMHGIVLGTKKITLA